MKMKINIEGSITTTSKTVKCVVNNSTTPPRVTNFLFMIQYFIPKVMLRSLNSEISMKIEKMKLS